VKVERNNWRRASANSKHLQRCVVALQKYTLWLILACTGAPAFSDPLAKQKDASLGLPPSDMVRSVVDSSKARLGERLFFDRKLSADGQVSCGSCHLPERSFTDGAPRSKGHRGNIGTRNAPSLLNVMYLQSLFWDGRAVDLPAQARAPFTNPVEHALADENELVRIVRDDDVYAAEFARLYPNPDASVRMEAISDALVHYERTLRAGGSPFDRYYYGKQAKAMSDAAVRGFELFRGRANCTTCHSIGPKWSLLTDQAFHVATRGIPRAVNDDLLVLAEKVVAATSGGDRRELERLIATDAQIAALGRFLVTLDPADIGKFKTPSLRNVALTAPYMHDGSVDTLEQAVELELYSRGAVAYPIVLTTAEKKDLVEFLGALSSPAVSRRKVR
jgi:cytochrome c peroxidase